ncbi:MAG: hypothetical protein LC797_14640 [Chloroflexi bacterium]|nr:hypothetical protein [Chloroflexota bacterium]
MNQMRLDLEIAGAAHAGPEHGVRAHRSCRQLLGLSEAGAPFRVTANIRQQVEDLVGGSLNEA